jgi:hypothetical protein
MDCRDEPGNDTHGLWSAGPSMRVTAGDVTGSVLRLARFCSPAQPRGQPPHQDGCGHQPHQKHQRCQHDDGHWHNREAGEGGCRLSRNHGQSDHQSASPEPWGIAAARQDPGTKRGRGETEQHVEKSRQTNLHLRTANAASNLASPSSAPAAAQRSTITLSATPSTACRTAATAMLAAIPTRPMRAHAAERPASSVAASPMRAMPSTATPANCPRWLHTHSGSAAYSAKAATASSGSAFMG